MLWDRIDVWEILRFGWNARRKGRGKPWSPHIGILLATRDEIWGTTLDEDEVPYTHRYCFGRPCPAALRIRH